MVRQDPDAEMAESTCRLCDENCTSMHSVFERVPEGRQVLHLIRDCLRIPIYRADPLPKRICDSCHTNLLSFNSFKKVTYENLERQRERMQSNEVRTRHSVRLYLNALEQDIDDAFSSRFYSAPVHTVTSTRLASLSNGHVENNNDDDNNSHTSSYRHNVASSSCSQTAPGDSDAQLLGDESDSECVLKIPISDIGPRRKRVADAAPLDDEARTPKRRRFVGPSSRIRERKDKYLRLLNARLGEERPIVRYEPLSLLRCCLNVINKELVEDYECEHFEAVRKKEPSDQDVLDENICDRCDIIFMNVAELAKHEAACHMFVTLGEKVDVDTLWEEDVDEGAFIRNKWLEDYHNNMLMVESYSFKPLPEKSLTNFDDSTGRVNVIDPDDVEFKDSNDEDERPSRAVREGYAIKGEVVLIDTQATVNGVLLSDLPKDGRRAIYKSVTVNGVKRKFCPLCRYTFKDNWAIECHYFSTACHYTCRFCGVRFNKQRTEFDTHIKQHILVGDKHTSRIFASRKFHSLPKVIHESRMKERPTVVNPRYYSGGPRVKPIKMVKCGGGDDDDQTMIPSFEIKKEIESDDEGAMMEDGPNPKSQAFFCRKCYEVFFKVDDFNEHVAICQGNGVSNAKNIRHQTRQQNINKPTKLSPTGRPIRNCVKEIATYSDEMQDDYDYTPYSFKKEHVKPTARGFECSQCNAAFPTFHSRNSHMRIHKNVHELGNKSVMINKNNRMMNQAASARRAVEIIARGKYGEPRIKQEPMEPIVEIHEQQQQHKSFPSSIGSVSITPIPSAYRKETKLDPSIMKLVQNNPNITIRKSEHIKQDPYSQGGPSNGGDFVPGIEQDGKCYRCLSCSKAFANKSNLYFHKKNQCSGSKYPCPFCKKRFGTEAAYSSHIFYNHPE